MAKPIIGTLKPIDASLDATITFSWSGNRAYSNRLVVYDNKTLSVIFDDTVTTYKFEHTIPADTLTNGKQYVIEIQVTDQSGNTSSMSNRVSLYTITTPIFQFSDIPSIIESSSYTANIYYYSVDEEELNLYKFYLYDADQKLLFETDVSYLDENENISYTYRSLENDSVYYIRATGVTVNGIELDTGYCKISIKFENQDDYARVYVENLPNIGCIKISTNIIVIQYNGDQEFSFQNGLIDLCDTSIFYDSGFNAEGDFTVIIRGMHLWHTGTLLKMSNGEYDITLSSRIYPDGQLRYKLEVPNGINTYIRYSEALSFTDDDMLTVAIRRINNLYQIVSFIELGLSDKGDTWYGLSSPSHSLASKYDYWINTDETPTIKVERDSVQILDDEWEPDNVVLNDLWFGREV